MLFRSRLFDAALLAAAAFFSFFAVAAYALAPKNEADAVAVIFAPWTGAADAVGLAVNAGGRFVRFGAFEFIAVIEPEIDDYTSRVRANGAWLVANPRALAACLERVTGRR
jgi:hypothetical protein